MWGKLRGRRQHALQVLPACCAALFAFSAAARADTWCVVPATGCNASHTEPTVAAALAATAANPGPDTIKLGAKTYAENDLTSTDSDPLTIVGAGNSTVLERQSTSGSTSSVLTVENSGAVHISDLRLHVIPSTDEEGLFVQTTGAGTVSGVTIDADSSASSADLVEMDSSGAWQLSNMALGPSASGDCLYTGGGAVQITDSVLACSTGLFSDGDLLLAQRLTIVAEIGIDISEGSSELDDSVVVASGYGALLASSAASGTITLNAYQDTVIGPGSSGTGVDCFNHVGGTGQVNLDDSIVRSFATSLAIDDLSGQPCSISAADNDYDIAAESVSGGGTGTITQSNVDNVDPQFIDPAAGDYRLKATSPVIDYDPTHLRPGESPTDRIGTVRIINNRRDLGAYERPFPATAVARPATALTRTTATLHGSANTGGATGTATFLYGTTTMYGQSSPATTLPASTSPTAVSATITGLRPGRVYHYALVVNTPYGTVRSADATFSPFGRLSVPRLRVGRRSVSVKLVCAGAQGATCTGTAALRTVEHVVGRTVVSLSRHGHRHIVLVGARQFRLAAGRSLTLTIPLNSTGRKLLNQFGRIPAVLTIIANSARGKVTVKTANVRV